MDPWRVGDLDYAFGRKVLAGRALEEPVAPISKDRRRHIARVICGLFHGTLPTNRGKVDADIS